MLPAQRNKIDVSSLSEEEQKNFRLYGKLPSRANVRPNNSHERKYFDLGDYALSKAGKAPQQSVGTAIPNPDRAPHASTVGGGSVPATVARHVANKDVVVVEESGIAKGIRRIVAVTGEEAAQVNRLAADAKLKLKTINAETDRARKDAALKAFSTELNQLEMSVLSKAELNEAFSTIWKKHDAEAKAKQNAETKLVQDTVTPYFSSERPNANFLVRPFHAGSKTKALQAGILVAKQLNKAIYLFSEEALPSEAPPQTAEEGAGTRVKARVAHVNLVPKQDLERGLKAKEWAEVITKSIGGRAGGKDDGVEGMGEDGWTARGDALTAAEQFVVLKTAESQMPMQ